VISKKWKSRSSTTLNMSSPHIMIDQQSDKMQKSSSKHHSATTVYWPSGMILAATMLSSHVLLFTLQRQKQSKGKMSTYLKMKDISS
jgi:DNA relaxase NicK